MKIFNIEVFGNKLENWENEFKTDLLQSLKKKIDAFKAIEIQDDNQSSDESDIPTITTSIEALQKEKEEARLVKHIENLYALISPVNFDVLENSDKFFDDLLNKITTILSNVQDLTIKKVAKTALKNLLNVIRVKQNISQDKIILGHKLDYQTIKDFAIMKNIISNLCNPSSIKLEDYIRIMCTINKIQRKRAPQLQKIFVEFPNFIKLLIETASKLLKENQEIVESSTKSNDFLNNEINYLIELLILNYRYQKNKYLHSISSDFKLTEELITSPEFSQIGQDNLKSILDLLCTIDKPFKLTYLKNLVQLIYLETASFQKELETGNVGKVEYANDFYKKQGEEQKSSEDFNQRIAMQIEEEGKDLNEEEMLNLAIKMSLDEENRQKEANNTLESKKFVFNFYRFDISYDLLKTTLNKIGTEITTNIEEYGILYKLVYKLLKMHHVLSIKASRSYNEPYIQLISNSLYQMVNFCINLIIINLQIIVDQTRI